MALERGASCACPRQGFFGQRRLSACNAITVPLAAGSHWLVHSDGITEAVATAGGQLAHDGLVNLLESSRLDEHRAPST